MLLALVSASKVQDMILNVVLGASLGRWRTPGSGESLLRISGDQCGVHSDAVMVLTGSREKRPKKV